MLLSKKAITLKYVEERVSDTKGSVTSLAPGVVLCWGQCSFGYDALRGVWAVVEDLEECASAATVLEIL